MDVWWIRWDKQVAIEVRLFGGGIFFLFLETTTKQDIHQENILSINFQSFKIKIPIVAESKF